jgi:signal transduction histidine kinase
VVDDETGLISYSPGNLKVETITDRVFENMAEMAAGKSISLTQTVSPGLTVFCRPVHARNHSRNLIGNAIKFTFPGGKIHVTAEMEMSKK